MNIADMYQFADSRNKDQRNGLALCKNAHWMFDHGLWSVTDDYRVIINRDKFIEEDVPGQKLADFDGHRLFLPSNSKYWPEPMHLAWHREQKFGQGVGGTSER
jgi:putative restriction endonuclease